VGVAGKTRSRTACALQELDIIVLCPVTSTRRSWQPPTSSTPSVVFQLTDSALDDWNSAVVMTHRVALWRSLTLVVVVDHVWLSTTGDTDSSSIHRRRHHRRGHRHQNVYLVVDRCTLHPVLSSAVVQSSYVVSCASSEKQRRQYISWSRWLSLPVKIWYGCINCFKFNRHFANFGGHWRVKLIINWISIRHSYFFSRPFSLFRLFTSTCHVHDVLHWSLTYAYRTCDVESLMKIGVVTVVYGWKFPLSDFDRKFLKPTSSQMFSFWRVCEG